MTNQHDAESIASHMPKRTVKIIRMNGLVHIMENNVQAVRNDGLIGKDYLETIATITS